MLITLEMPFRIDVIGFLHSLGADSIIILTVFSLWVDVDVLQVGTIFRVCGGPERTKKYGLA